MIKTLYPEFRRWSERGSVWLVSDTHFDDPNREYMGYEVSTEEHFQYIIETCHKNDTLIHLGDVGNKEYFRRIKSHKVLILGNHDHRPGYYEDCFDEIYDGPLFVADRILLSHEPIYGLSWCINLHGHTHRLVNKELETHICICQNVINYSPINLGKIIKDGVLANIENIHRLTIDHRAISNVKDNNKYEN